MAERIPPFTALRAFEAAARLNSFTRAAEELFVTPAAISQQVKLLEDIMQVQLFERTNRGIRITEAGAQCYPMMTEGFDMLRRAAQRLRTFRPESRFIVSAWPSLASLWLGPNLFRWLEMNPGLQITVTAAIEEPNFDIGEVDVRIGAFAHSAKGLIAEELMTDRLIPVCSPEYFASHPGLDRPEKLLDCDLIHVDWGVSRDILPPWRDWGEAAGVADLGKKPGPVFNLLNLALQAAVEGKGVVLAQALMAEQDLKSGRLVQVCEHSIAMPQPYYLTYAEHVLDRPYGRELVEWIRGLTPSPENVLKPARAPGNG